ncbi:chitinase [Lactobacillus sp. DCY120]|uniref:chitinase n=1 Tax=Bombilactobacillus apium TaxID=2675299 RepID=A0A850R2Z0_9LACO|nr:glycosyl hydrolase family 18 protein [Bombilactobacillus apium]NVY96371.1 chitinase [Bombilactobacillus apium]
MLKSKSKALWTGLLIISSLIVAWMCSQNVQTVQATSSPYRNVMYYGDWSIWGGQGNFYPKDIPADQLTHLNYAFLDFDSQGNLKFTDKDAATGAPVGQEGVQWNSASAGLFNAFQDLRAKNPNLKIGVSIGGWSKSGDFSTVAADPAIRAKFVKNIASFIKYTDLDFVDIDWEYPAAVRQPDKVDNTNDEGTPNAKAADKQNYIKLLQEIRKEIDSQGQKLGKTYELSVALPAAQSKLKNGIDVPQLFKVIDFANVMTYDLNGAWTPNSAHQTALYGNPKDPDYASGLSIDQTVKYLEKQGAPSQKLVIGAAFYSRGWNKVAAGTDASHPGLFQPATKNNKDADQTLTYGAENYSPKKAGDGGRAGGVWPYRNFADLKTKTPDLKEYWDDVAKAPYMYSQKTGEFYTYDNPRSVGYKAAYVKEHHLGGVISWMQSQDKETTSTKRDALTKAIKNGLFGTSALPARKLAAPQAKITATVVPYKENGAGYEITIHNQAQVQETDEVLKMVETAAATVKLPKLYLPVNGSETLSKGDYRAGDVTVKDGQVVVDLASVYDAHEIEPGATYTFRLKSSAKEVDVKRISKITLAQRFAKNGAEQQQQTIYGK